jgi:hypothetical protein
MITIIFNIKPTTIIKTLQVFKSLVKFDSNYT